MIEKELVMRKKNVQSRRLVALENLRNAKFFEKKDRTKEDWQKRVADEIKTLEARVR